MEAAVPPPTSPDDLDADALRHSHDFGQQEHKHGERPTRWVVVVTAVTMVVEIVAGIVFGSMALLADGLHMASHAVALGIAAVAYLLARRHARDPRLSFGTGKASSLAGFTSALLLAGVAAIMAVESVGRLVAPKPIRLDEALVVAVLGLLVNGACLLILGGHHGHDHPHHHAEGTDHNLRAARLHVFADAITSVLAIFALLGARFLGLLFMDPIMGVVGALLVGRWSWQLLRDTSGVLLDRQASPETIAAIRGAIESGGGAEVVDIHTWSIGPGYRAAIISVLAARDLTPQQVKQLLPPDLGLAHVTVEIHRRP